MKLQELKKAETKLKSIDFKQLPKELLQSIKKEIDALLKPKKKVEEVKVKDAEEVKSKKE